MKLPPIADKLAPALAILQALNEHLQIDSCYWDLDGVAIEVLLEGEIESQHAVDKLVESVLMVAYDMLPEGYGIIHRSRKFAVEWVGITAEIVEEAPTPRLLERVPMAFRLAPEARTNFAADGTPITGYALLNDYRFKGEVLQANRVEYAREQLRLQVAHDCACAPEYVTPISIEEYLAVGNSGEE